MTLGRLIERSLRYYWRTGVVVVFGLAVATAVITGALVIGSSVRGSLGETALARLGEIEYALVAPRYFREGLLEEVLATPEWQGQVRAAAAVLNTSGPVRHTETQVVAAQVAVWGVGEDFRRLYPEAAIPELSGRQVAINAALAGDLGAEEGDSLLVTVSRESPVATESLFARRKAEQVMSRLRVEVRAVLPDRGPGGLRTDAGSATARNLFLDREWLQTQIEQEGRVNALLLAAEPEAEEGLGRQLGEALEQAADWEDRGTGLKAQPGYLLVHSEAVTLGEEAVRELERTAEAAGARAERLSVHLATRLARPGPALRRELAYAVVAGIEGEPDLRPIAGGGTLDEQGLWLNRWAAEDLGAEVGEELELSYLVPTWEGEYVTGALRLVVQGIVEMTGQGADPGLAPDFEGITDAPRVGDWDPPFPVDLRRAAERDEEYWELYRAAPKVFVALETARKMWQSGAAGEGAEWVTGVRIVPPEGLSAEELAGRIGEDLRRASGPFAGGAAPQPLREAVLEAARGTTDFSQLMLGMSMFLVLSGAGLAGMLLRLSVQRRAGQAGLMLAVGCEERQVRAALLGEGWLLSAGGAVLGAPLGVLYAAGMIAGLTGWWSGAIAETDLWLHVRGADLGSGALAGMLVGVLAAWWSTRALSRRTARELLPGWRALAVLPRQAGQGVGLALAGSVAGALALVGLAGLTETLSPAGAFFGAGFLLLLAGVAGAALVLQRALRRRGASRSWAALALRSAAANRGRSLLTLGLLASATFVIVAVAANARGYTQQDLAARDSGTGGFALQAVSSLPLRYDLGSPRGRENLGFAPEQEEALAECEVISLRTSPGQDISCLNLSRPTHPRLLGVSEELISRGGFSIRTREQPPEENPWRLLERGPEEVAAGEPAPAFADADTAQWSLQAGLGDEYVVSREHGEEQAVRFVGLLRRSILQSEILLHEDWLRRLYPGVPGPSYFLIDTPAGREQEVAEALRAALGEQGLEVRSTAEVLNAYLRVQNTYLAMFLALGGLGLVLGSVGLVAVILRSALERRGEFALMLATGMERNDLARLLLLENAGLLAAGLVWGAAAALVAVAPQLASAEAQVNWLGLLGVLAAILIVGVGASAAAARAAVSGRLLEALREE